ELGHPALGDLDDRARGRVPRRTGGLVHHLERTEPGDRLLVTVRHRLLHRRDDRVDRLGRSLVVAHAGGDGLDEFPLVHDLLLAFVTCWDEVDCPRMIPCRADAPDTRPTRAGRASATSALLPPAELLLYPLLDLGHLPLGPLDVRVVLGNLAAARPDLVGDGRCQPRTGGPEFLRSHGVLLLSALPTIDPGSVRPPLALPAGKHHRSRRH